MRELKKETAREVRRSFGRLSAMWGDRRLRRILVRYLLPVIFLLFFAVMALLPIVSFRTAAGESDMRSLLYWHTANFFGTDDARGAYELLQLSDPTNMYYGFYRAVVILCVIDAVAAVLGFLFTILHSVSAIYLLATEEKNKRSALIGRLFRVFWGNRWTAMIPYTLSVIPFAFPMLFAYFSTTFRTYDTAAGFLLIDPLWVALVCLAVELALILRTYDGEKRSRWNIYVAPEHRVSQTRDEEDRETREWAAAVRADAETDEPSVDPTKREDPSSETVGAEDAEIEGDKAGEVRASIRELFDDSDSREK
ncbi:MAG: hypothetical protein IKC26_06495 [Clostridia bacterium]|nr:hypothetical protein [Clostridia bacterium]